MSYKLVRDNIPSIIKFNNHPCKYAKCESEDLLIELLKDKFNEEVDEFKFAFKRDADSIQLDCALEEAADVLTVMLALLNKIHPSEKITVENVLSKYNYKAKMRGEFKEGYILFEENKE